MEIKPDFHTFKSLAKKYSLVPAFAEIPADLDTPLTVYLKLAAVNPYAALLESVEGGEKFGRYSFISISHLLRFESKGNRVELNAFGSPEKFSFLDGTNKKILESADPMNELRKIFHFLRPATIADLPRFCGGAIGMVSYDMVRKFEKLPDLLESDLNIPDSLFLFTDECVIFDHWKHKIFLIKWNVIENKSESGMRRIYLNAQKSLNRLGQRLKRPAAVQSESGKNHSKRFDLNIRSNFSLSEFKSRVGKIKEYIQAGDVIQTVFSQRFESECESSPINVYRALRMINPSPYLYFLNMNQFSLAGSSPEILVRKEGGRAINRPIAGTRRRGRTEAEDLALEKELLADPKERAEHLMLVDLGRNDLGRCCRPGTVTVPDFMTVERYSHVMHLVSTVEGTLNKNQDAFSLFKACFPAGTVTGAPKIRAMEIIEELENVRRDSYAGSVGYFSYSGDMDMAITIRTILFKGQKIYMQAGAGIVADSIPEREEQETRSKATALFKAVELAERSFR